MRYLKTNFWFYIQESQIFSMYSTMINQKLQAFEDAVKLTGQIVTQATIELYKGVTASFLPTPAKIHYLYNLRDISKVHLILALPLMYSLLMTASTDHKLILLYSSQLGSSSVSLSFKRGFCVASTFFLLFIRAYLHLFKLSFTCCPLSLQITSSANIKVRRDSKGMSVNCVGNHSILD